METEDMDIITQKLEEADRAVSIARKAYERIGATLADLEEMQAKAKKYLADLQAKLPQTHAAFFLSKILIEEVQGLENRVIVTQRLIENDFPLAKTGLIQREHAARLDLIQVSRERDKLQELQEMAEAIKQNGGCESKPIATLQDGLTNFLGRDEAQLYVKSLLEPDEVTQDPDEEPEDSDTETAEGESDKLIRLLTPEQLQSRLREKNLSVNHFAKISGYSQSFVAKVLKGTKKMSPGLSMKAREILQI